MGIASHGIGTARAFQESEQAGAFAALAMGLERPAHRLAALGFWAGIPWALKMPIGHLVDLLWRRKAGTGLARCGTLIAASLLIMIRAGRRAAAHGRA
jgi:hypothetical protein